MQIHSQAHSLFFFNTWGLRVAHVGQGFGPRATQRSMYNCFGAYDLIAKRSAWSALAEHIHPGQAGRDKNFYTKTRGSYPHLPLEITEYMHIDVITTFCKENASMQHVGPKRTRNKWCTLLTWKGWRKHRKSKQLKIKAWKKNMP